MEEGRDLGFLWNFGYGFHFGFGWRGRTGGSKRKTLKDGDRDEGGNWGDDGIGE